MESRNRRELAKTTFIVHIVLCTLVPPLGMLFVWRNRYHRPVKLVMTFCSTLILMLMFSIGLRLQAPEEIIPTPMSASYMNQNQEPEATTSPSSGYVTPDFGNIQSGDSDPSGDDYIAPANPQG